MTDTSRVEANIEFTMWIRYPDVQLRFSNTDHGKPTRFVIQLVRIVDEEWVEVVRFDHDVKDELSPDIREEGPTWTSIEMEISPEV